MQPVYPDLKGRAAIVTGASSGIGLGIARALLAQGMRVAVHYRSGREPAEALGAEHPGRAFAVGADLGTERGCGNLAREAVERLGGVDVLVHSAGIWNPGPIEQMEAERLEEMFRVNVFSAFYLVRELAAPLRASGHGSIVLVGSALFAFVAYPRETLLFLGAGAVTAGTARGYRQGIAWLTRRARVAIAPSNSASELDGEP